MNGVCIDIETTGFSKNDSIISISLLKFTGPRVDDIFSTQEEPYQSSLLRSLALLIIWLLAILLLMVS